MRRDVLTTLTLTAAVSAALGLGGCSSSSPDGGSQDSGSSASPTASTTSSSPQDLVAGLQDAVDATLAADSFEIGIDTSLEIGSQRLSLRSEGAVDYPSAVADVTIALDQDGMQTRIALLSDGTTLWASAEGPGQPPVPAGKTWIQGDAQRLRDSTTFTQSGLVGVALVLRGATQVEDRGTDEVDGVEVHRYATTVVYQDALDAAGDLAPALQSSFSLSGAATRADLDVEVAIGADDVVRELDVTVKGGDLPVSGTYRLSVAGVGEPVSPPDAPSASTVLSGPRAESLLDQLIS